MDKKKHAAREAKRKARKRESGLVRLEVWIKEEFKPQVKEFVLNLMSKH